MTFNNNSALDLCNISNVDIISGPVVGVTKKSSLHYRFQIFKSKGAVIALLWCFTGLLMYCFLSQNQSPLLIHDKAISGNVVVSIGVLVYPIFGWLADVHFGRYNTIKWSLRFMCFVSIVFCSVSAVLSSGIIQPTAFNTYHRAIRWIMYLSNTVSLGGLQANVVQFGIDQLIDASSGEITSFIRWFFWMFYLAEFMVSLTQVCICHQYKLVALLLLPVCLSFALCIDFFFNGLLAKEPTSKNPLTLIFRVLKYAIKNKYPRLRSAFAYWDNQHCSRIDIGKSKYGGPFSTEEVESVKIFWRIVGMMVACSFFAGLVINILSVGYRMEYHFHDNSYVRENKNNGCDYDFMRGCLRHILIKHSGAAFMVLFIPLFEFVFYPLFKRYFNPSILKKFLGGIILSILGLLGFMCLEFIGHHQSNTNNTIVCLLSAKEYKSGHVLPLSYEWITIPSIILYISCFTLLASGGEFLCSQSPYSMKGLLFGLLYGFVGFFIIILIAVLQLVLWLINKFSTVHYGCGVWYMLFIFILCLLSLVLYYCVYKCYYRKRLRNENSQNLEENNYFS